MVPIKNYVALTVSYIKYLLHLLHQFISFLSHRLWFYCIDAFSMFQLLTLVVEEDGGSAVPYQAPIQKWEPVSMQQRHGSSIVEVYRIIEETVDQFFALKIPMRSGEMNSLF
ncbi:unnamed protein product [Lactuca saligna]|uniref:PATROL1-like C-terminal domain-containing protein n=1 Tax=Lactuca saligna TaxID=75948 RepID=A0AA35Y7K9_LACSI|nr:unnamed protein product [Lactuca saligna]